jgi:hypothetical protein
MKINQLDSENQSAIRSSFRRHLSDSSIIFIHHEKAINEHFFLLPLSFGE